MLAESRWLSDRQDIRRTWRKARVRRSTTANDEGRSLVLLRTMPLGRELWAPYIMQAFWYIVHQLEIFSQIAQALISDGLTHSEHSMPRSRRSAAYLMTPTKPGSLASSLKVIAEFEGLVSPLQTYGDGKKQTRLRSKGLRLPYWSGLKCVEDKGRKVRRSTYFVDCNGNWRW